MEFSTLLKIYKEKKRFNLLKKKTFHAKKRPNLLAHITMLEKI